MFIKAIFPVKDIFGMFLKKMLWFRQWILFWIGRSLMYFGINFIMNTVANLIPKEIIELELIKPLIEEYEEIL